jgi:hypothetical protein
LTCDSSLLDAFQDGSLEIEVAQEVRTRSVPVVGG